MFRYLPCWLLFVTLALPAPALAGEGTHPTLRPPLVIDTDMGLDDLVTLALILQQPELSISAIVAVDGVSSSARGVQFLARLLRLFNRADIPLYRAAPDPPDLTPPTFRAFAEQSINQVLPRSGIPKLRPFSAEIYELATAEKPIILALGPLTNLALALKKKPELAQQVARVIIASRPAPASGWNLQYDPAALAAVQAAGIPLVFVAKGASGQKPRAWAQQDLVTPPLITPAAQLLQKLLQPAAVKKHYAEEIPLFTDELALMYLVDPAAFKEHIQPHQVKVAHPRQAARLATLFATLVQRGRQIRPSIVWSPEKIPPTALRPDVQQIRQQSLARHGSTEWPIQLLLNELHQHLGAFSIIGAKMGLRAAELLNAPLENIRVVSHAARRPPVSCLNDGVMVATGSTPGRGLFHFPGGPAHSTRVTFIYGARRVTLALKQVYMSKVIGALDELVRRYGLQDERYWSGVRKHGLHLWSDWSREEIFDVVELREL